MRQNDMSGLWIVGWSGLAALSAASGVNCVWLLRQGFLANGTAIPTYAHKPHHVAVYLKAVTEVFGAIAGWLDEAGGDDAALESKLLGPMAGAPAIRQRLVR